MKYHLLIAMVLFLIPAVSCSTSTALEPTPTSPPELPQELLDAVPFAVPDEGPTETWQQARRFFIAAYILQLQGELEEAIKQYQRSIDTYPTAEAHTFLGWTYGWMGRYEEAIQKAEQAIALDPEYGNPYNDIGYYLTQQGKLDEAIPWLMRAMEAKRYASPHYPWLNLGRIWVLKGEWGRALTSYEEVWRLAPEYPVPAIPVLEAAHFLPPHHARNPGTMAEQEDAKEAIRGYFYAWNNYDADTLQDFSEPLNTHASTTLLLHLAAAKLGRATITVYKTKVLHLENDVAVAETSVSMRGKSDTIWHLLRKTNGTWKVVVRLLPGGDPTAPQKT